MKPLDYGRSFLIGNGPFNEVRFWVESRTRIMDEKTGAYEDYIQTGSCKSEHTFAEKDLFHEDNYDFLPIFGPAYGVIFRRKAYLTEDYRQCVRTEEMWNGQKHHLIGAVDSELLSTHERVLAATYAGRPIVAQTEIWNDNTGCARSSNIRSRR